MEVKLGESVGWGEKANHPTRPPHPGLFLGAQWIRATSGVDRKPPHRPAETLAAQAGVRGGLPSPTGTPGYHPAAPGRRRSIVGRHDTRANR